METRRKWLSFVAVLLLGSVTGVFHAAADDVPKDIAADVDAGTTTAKSEPTFAAPVKELGEEPEPGEEDRTIDWSLTLGGAINTGNTQSWNLNAGTDYKLVKKAHELTLNSIFNYGRANVDPADPDTAYATVSKQLFFNARYNYFVTKKNAIWASLGERWDPLAGFDTQLLANLGYLRAFIKKKGHYWAGRIGYSYTYENFRSPPADVTGDSHIQGLLAAMDYENKLNEHVELLSTLATIYNLNRIDVQDAGPFEDIRIYFTVALLSKIAKKLAFEARFLMLYDRVPAAPQKTDTTTIFGLVYTLL